MERSEFSTAEEPARIPPIAPAEWTDEVRNFFATVEGPTGQQSGTRLNIILTIAHHPELAQRYFNFGIHILRFSTLSPRMRELVTLRTAWLYDSEYEWTKHAHTALGIGISAVEVEATKTGPEAPNWSPFERDLFRAVDQIVCDNGIDDTTWASIAQNLDRRQQLDFLFTVGSYAMLAMVLNGLKVQLEPE